MKIANHTDHKQILVFFVLIVVITSIILLSLFISNSNLSSDSRAASGKPPTYNFVSCDGAKCNGKGQCPKGTVSDLNSPCNEDFLGVFYCCKNPNTLKREGDTFGCIENKPLASPPSRPCSFTPFYSVTQDGIVYGGLATVKSCCRQQTTIEIQPTAIPKVNDTQCGPERINCTTLQAISSSGSKQSAGAFCYDNKTGDFSDDYCITGLSNLQVITGQNKECDYFQKNGLSYTKSGSRCYFSTKDKSITLFGAQMCRFGFTKSITEYSDSTCKEAQIRS